MGTTHDIYWYNRPAGAYKLATYLRRHGFTVQVIINCTALSKQGFQRVFDTYGSAQLLWIGFTSNWLSGVKEESYYDSWQNSSDPVIDAQLTGWFYTEHDNREKVYSCVYSTAMLESIWDMAKLHNPNCQLLFGGSQLNRNEYFSDKLLVPNAVYIKNNAESAVLELSQRYLIGNFNCDNLPSNDYYDYNEFKHSFIEYQDTDHIEAHEWLPIEVSRGCAFKCAFCNYDMKGVTNNYVDANFLREEIIKMWEKHGTTKFVIMDDLYNDNYDKVKDLHDNCWSKLPFKPELAGYLRLDLLWRHPEQAEMLRADGWRAGSFGIETLHERAGKRVGKGLGKARILETLTMLKEIWQDEVLIHAFFIAGLPYEPMESLEETYTWTTQTDLFHAVIWHWLELENIKAVPTTVDKISIIGKDPKKYGYTFINSSDWVNESGVTLDQAKEFNKKANLAKLNVYFTLYADLRALGWSHEKILTMCKDLNFMQYLQWEVESKKPASIARLLKIISKS